MHMKLPAIRVGMRTLKTAAAVIIAMVIVDFYGTSSSKLVFAMLGAMAAVQPTFRDSLESCLTEIVGVIIGAVVGVLLLLLPINRMVMAGIGIVLIISVYNFLHIRFSPTLPCMIVVILCTTPDSQPILYAFERIWDSAIGLSMGMVINSLVFPYDNSRQIRATMESLDKEVLRFLEEMFDGDDVLPDGAAVHAKIGAIRQQMYIFSNQKLLMKLRRQKQQLEVFQICEHSAQELVAQMEVLGRMGKPGRLNEENLRRLKACGAKIRDARRIDTPTEADVVTNYHVAQILLLRRELLSALK